ncbi:MAG: ABC transporter permease [Gammaproteobacteria bacterium]|nr:MAG: ABC transporter permease [Gammaproteobacteria bacterium]
METPREPLASDAPAVSRGRRRLPAWLNQSGFLCALPLLVLLLLGFVAPLMVVVGYSFMPPNTFDFAYLPTMENFLNIINESYYRSFLWSFGLAVTTVFILLFVCYPLAYGMAKMFGRWSNLLALLLVIPLFVSENIRLYGWVLFLIKGGVLLGTLQSWFGVSPDSMMYTVPAIVLGLVYVYLPFTLFPMVLGISMVPREVTEAAADLGASRWQVFLEVELPLAMPGYLIGAMLTFVLALGSLAESKILGGQTVIMIADDIETAFTYGQNWPLGSALSVLLIVLVGSMVLYLLKHLDLDAILGRR